MSNLRIGGIAAAALALPVMLGLYKGTHVRSPLVSTYRGQHVKVEMLENTAWMDIDGDGVCGELCLGESPHPRRCRDRARGSRDGGGC